MLVARKERLGDWEGDTVIGANHKGALLTLVDRKSTFRLFARLKSKTAEEVNKGMGRCFYRLLKEHPRFGTINRLARTITFDNGKEFSAHQALTEAFALGSSEPGNRGLTVLDRYPEALKGNLENRTFWH